MEEGQEGVEHRTLSEISVETEKQSQSIAEAYSAWSSQFSSPQATELAGALVHRVLECQAVLHSGHGLSAPEPAEGSDSETIAELNQVIQMLWGLLEKQGGVRSLAEVTQRYMDKAASLQHEIDQHNGEPGLVEHLQTVAARMEGDLARVTRERDRSNKQLADLQAVQKDILQREKTLRMELQKVKQANSTYTSQSEEIQERLTEEALSIRFELSDVNSHNAELQKQNQKLRVQLRSQDKALTTALQLLCLSTADLARASGLHEQKTEELTERHKREVAGLERKLEQAEQRHKQLEGVVTELEASSSGCRCFGFPKRVRSKVPAGFQRLDDRD